ncbi:hypothetical protein MNBD_PLANCTO02-1906 [hydrothermal vent metagenome]|uniref:Uncharacterized protein n=1 Tax=hydrothermal vent metagenome TaxID=652676 RepID=A0A3B1DUZ3_9ZZZZ
MKLSIKDIHFKELLVNHGEKIVFGLIAFMAVVIISPIGTSWTGFDKQPEEFKKAVERGEVALKQNTWSDEMSKQFNNQNNILEKAVHLIPEEKKKPKIIAEMLAKFGGIKDFDPSITKQAELYGEPKFYPPLISPIVTSEQFVMQTVTEIEGGDATLETPGGVPNVPKANGGKFEIKGGGNNAAVPDKAADPDDSEKSEQNEVVPVNTGEGMRANVIRFVFPIDKLYEAIAKASHREVDDIKHDVEILGFDIQRQEATAGPNPWAGKWEDMSIESSIEVLKKSAGFAEDNLHISAKDNALTEPMPMRVMGYWDELTSHPLIKKFLLKEEDIKKQNELIEAIKKQSDENSGMNDPNTVKIPRGGFTGLTRNSGSMTRDIMEGDNRNQMIEGIRRNYRSDGPDRGRTPDADDIENQLAVLSPYLLFRYLDFDIKPGRIYRYRARVKIKNPNFNRHLGDVTRPAVAQGIARDTRWSEPTPPVLVPPDVKMFVERITIPIKKTEGPTAWFKAFVWKPDAGTVVYKQMGFSPGEILSKKTNTYVLRPGLNTFNKEDIELGTTEKILVDIDDDSFVDKKIKKKVVKDLFEDLGLSRIEKNKIKIGTVGQVLVVDEYGRMIFQNALADENDKNKNYAQIDARDKALKDLKGAKKKEETEGMEEDDLP